MMHVRIPRTPDGLNDCITRRVAVPHAGLMSQQPIRAAVRHAPSVQGNKPGVSERKRATPGTSKSQNRTPGVRG
jgi:hypothetical protein